MNVKLFIVVISIAIWGALLYWAKPFFVLLSSGFDDSSKYDVKETLSEYPYQVTALPYEMSFKEGFDIAWLDNERVLFIEEVRDEKGEYLSRLSMWSEQQGHKVIRNHVSSVCSRDGLVGALETGKNAHKHHRDKKRYFGKIDNNVPLPGDKRINLKRCFLFSGNSSESRSHIENGYEIPLLNPQLTLWNPFKYEEEIPGRLLYNGDLKSYMPFRASLPSSSLLYLDHLDGYFINRISNQLCTKSGCQWMPHNYAFFLSKQGDVDVIKWDLPWLYAITGKWPSFDVYPITKHKYLYFSSNRVRGPHPFKEVGLHTVDLETKKVELILKGTPITADISPNGCKVAVSRKVKGVTYKFKGRSIQLAIINLCQPNLDYSTK